VSGKDNVRVIVRRRRGHGGGHHGGAWKIAYADFVTAMMAFFLVMWLLNSMSPSQLRGISDYFKTPLKVAMAGGASVGQSDSILDGGGKDLTKEEGQVQKADISTPVVDLKQAEAQVEEAERAKLEDVKKQIEAAIEANPQLAQFRKQILLDMTQEGLRIQIMDENQRPMFKVGSAKLESYTGEILHEIGRVLDDVPNRLSISGHTDATPYSGGETGYSNWELSADRGNAARRELLAGGMAEDRILRVVGLASAVPFNPEKIDDPVNRRISIIVLNKRTENAISAGAGKPPADAAAALEQGPAGPLLDGK
jgi:chemotaxis protein MotB